MIIGITGTLGAGKGTIVEQLKKRGFKHFSARDFITKEIIKRGLPVNRDSMVLVANDLRSKHSPSYVAEQLFKLAEIEGGNCVIESLRTPAEIECLKSKGKFVLFAIDADAKLRYERVVARKSETDKISFDVFKENEKREMISKDPNKQNLKKCIEMADFVFMNNQTINDLNEKVLGVLNKLGI